MEPLVLSDEQVAQLLIPADALVGVERAFAAMATEEGRNYPVVREAIGHRDALFGFKSGYDRGRGVLGFKAGGYWPHNPDEGLSSHQSTVCLFDPDSGRLAAVLGGNHITALRTAAAAAVSVKYLAREDSRVLGLIGAGHQAPYQVRAICEQRPIEEVLVWNRSEPGIARLKAVLADLGIPVRSVQRDVLCARADIIVTITSCHEPLLAAGVIRPGTLLACMGTDTRGKQEVAPELVAAAAVYTDEPEQAISIGECQHAHRAGLLPRDRIVPLGEVVHSGEPVQSQAGAFTLFDGTGVSLQDLAVAQMVLEKVRR